MPQGNAEVVRAVFEAINAGDFSAVPEHFTDDVVLVIHDGGLAGNGAAGKAAFVRWFSDWFRTFEPGYRFDITEPRAEGDRVFLDVAHHARGRASGVEVTMASSWSFEFRDGRIARCDCFSG